MPQRDRSGPSWLMPLRVQSDRGTFRSIGACRNLGCTYSMYNQTRQVFPGRWNEVWFHRFPSPPFGSLFILFHLAHFFSLLFFHVFPCFISCRLISFLLLRTHGSALSMYTHHLLSTQALGRPGLCNEVVVIGCPCALGSFSLQPHTPLSHLVSSLCLHSFVSLRTRSHICSDLSASRLPSGRGVFSALSVSAVSTIYLGSAESFGGLRSS